MRRAWAPSVRKSVEIIRRKERLRRGLHLKRKVPGIEPGWGRGYRNTWKARGTGEEGIGREGWRGVILERDGKRAKNTRSATQSRFYGGMLLLCALFLLMLQPRMCIIRSKYRVLNR